MFFGKQSPVKNTILRQNEGMRKFTWTDQDFQCFLLLRNKPPKPQNAPGSMSLPTHWTDPRRGTEKDDGSQRRWNPSSGEERPGQRNRSFSFSTVLIVRPRGVRTLRPEDTCIVATSEGPGPQDPFPSLPLRSVHSRHKEVLSLSKSLRERP